MNNDVRFYGLIIWNDADKEGYAIEIGDIYLKQANKWLKADSSSAAKLSNYMDVLKAAKSFAFYTKHEQNSTRSNFRGERFLKDAVEKRHSGQKVFTLKIIAVIGGSTFIVRCADCVLAQSMMIPTPIGTVQSYEIRFKDATVEKLAGTFAAG